MRSLRAATITLTALLALSACNGGDDPTDPMATWTPSGTIEAPSTTAPPDKPVEPSLPAAAKKATEAGARAFITYYWDLINYAQLTGDVKALDAVSGTTCAGCSKGIAAIRKVYEPGGHAVGGEYVVTINRMMSVTSKDRSLYGFEAKLHVRNAEQTIFKKGGAQEVLSPETTKFLSYLIWTDDAWRTDVLEPK